MPFVILPTNSASGGYDITNSARFVTGDSLTRTVTPSSSTSYTVSFWLKLSDVTYSSTPYLWSVGSSANGNGIYLFDSDRKIYFFDYPSGFLSLYNGVLRDPSAWYHVVWSVNSGTGTGYINGITGNTHSSIPALNDNTGNKISIHDYVGTGYNNVGCYMSEFNFIDGTALTPSSFGETDSDTGIWKPKAYTGTYGTNGFYLQFKNSASLGTDSSGNGNTFTVNNLTSIDQTTDTPTNNFATINGVEGITKTLTEGNLSLTGSSKSPRGTIGVSTGKWYWECKLITQISSTQVVGICNESHALTNDIGVDSNGWGYIIQSNANNGQAYHSGSVTQYATLTTNDILNIAVDMDNQAIYFGKNGTWQNSGVPTSGSSKTGAIYTNLPTSGFVFPAFVSSSTGVIQANFGNPPYSANSYTDGAGYGNFSYAVPSGYYALCTKNLANFG